MTTWTSAELTKIEKAEELQIASLQRDGTLTNPVTIWVVRVGDDLYVRAVNGRNGVWFQATQVRHEGHISAGYVDKDVIFVDADPGIYDQVDAAFRTKYHHYGKTIVHTDLTPQARGSTLKLVPR